MVSGRGVEKGFVGLPALEKPSRHLGIALARVSLEIRRAHVPPVSQAHRAIRERGKCIRGGLHLVIINGIPRPIIVPRISPPPVLPLQWRGLLPIGWGRVGVLQRLQWRRRRRCQGFPNALRHHRVLLLRLLHRFCPNLFLNHAHDTFHEVNSQSASKAALICN